MNPNILLLTLLISSFLIVPCLAGEDDVTITFSDIDIPHNQKILIYNSEGDFISENTTTDTVSLNRNFSYVFIFKPSTQSWFEDPLNSLTFLQLKMPAIISFILWLFIALGIFYLIIKIGGK